jgi:hypothetical protein
MKFAFLASIVAAEKLLSEKPWAGMSESERVGNVVSIMEDQLYWCGSNGDRKELKHRNFFDKIVVFRGSNFF